MNIAIYVRKSIYSDKSDSTDVQYKMGVEYANSHYTGYKLYRYEDEGFTGANINRPGFNLLVDDINNKKIDVIICYKIDRISRNVLDFSKFFGLLTEKNIEFVSIKEQIDTSTPLGRAMMYICSVFAQMERETIAERVKDNMIELAKSGKWAGGKSPLGYARKKETLNGKTHTVLIKNSEEIPFLNFIFDTFLKGFSLNTLESHFRSKAIKTLNGKYLSSSQIYNILKNPHYVAADDLSYDYFRSLGCIMCDDKSKFDGSKGIVAYGRTTGGKKKKHSVNPPEKWFISVGYHEPIIPSEKWLAVQKKFGQNVFDKTRKHNIGLLKGIVKCSCGYTMGIQHKVISTYNKTYDNYFCRQRDRRGTEYCDRKMISVSEMDNEILNLFKKIVVDKNIIDNYTVEKSESFTGRNKAEIQKDINDSTLKIENLTGAISTNRESAAAKYLISELEKIDKQIASLQFELREYELMNRKKKDYQDSKDTKYNAICNIVNSLDTATYEEINYMLKSILIECIYDGKSLIIRI